MRVDYDEVGRGFDNHQRFEFTPNALNIELRDVFNGVTFVTEDGERLSVSMRDRGFEVHYYSLCDIKEPHSGCSGFDAGWFRFNNGACENDKPEPTQEMARRPYGRMDAWRAAMEISDVIVEKHPLAKYQGAGVSLVVAGPTHTEADQRLAMIIRIADWLLGKEGN